MKDKFIKDQQLKLSRGTIDRRQFMTSVLATGIAVPAALTLAKSAEAATPKKGGHMKAAQGHGSTTDTLDPATFENGYMNNVSYTFNNHLTEVSSKGELIGELAESYESSDAKTWMFNLRKGVEFHNGKTMTPEDVILSLQHHMGEDSKSAAKGLLTQVEEMKQDGSHGVKMVLKNANADFPYIMSDYHLAIRASKDGKVDMLDPKGGTGAYYLNKFEPGVRAEGTRNPNFFKDGSGHFDSYEHLSILDVTARQQALMNGDVYVIDKVSAKTVNLLSRAPNINIKEVTGTLHYTFPMRLDVEPFGNYDLRMALKLSVKRQELVDKVLFGHGALGNDHPISTANRYHNSSLPQREFNPEKAAEHYKKSGHSGPIKLSAADAAFNGAVDAAQLMANSAKECGINIEVVREPKDGYWSNVWNKKGWSACYWGGRPTEDWMFSAAYTNDTEWNDTAWKGTDSSKKFNGLVKAAKGELDDAKRRKMYEECQMLVHDDGGTICPMFANYIMGVNKKIVIPENIAANWELDGGKMLERWWFA